MAKVETIFQLFSILTLLHCSTISSQMLNKSSNSLSSIKIKELETKNNWQIIDLSHNAIEFIDPPELLQKQNDLETLQLDFNSNFSARENKQIFEHKRLKRLSCKGCGFVEVQSQHFAGFGNLLVLDLSANKITKIDVTAFKSNRNLQQLDVSENNLKVLHFSTFTGLPKFEDLRLSMNPIEMPKNKPFLKCESLKRLTMDSCQLADIHPQTFSEVRNVEVLSLNYNRIELLPVESFKLNLKLKSLFFESNKLKFFPASIVDYLSELRVLCVDNNTYVDGQEFQKFRKKYVERSLRGLECKAIDEFKIENLFVPETTTLEVTFDNSTSTPGNDTVHPARFFHPGISDFFMGSYISMILISQVVIFILLALYLIKLEKFGNFDGDECLADSFISDDPLHKIYRLDEE